MNVVRSEHLELFNLRRRHLEALLEGRWNELEKALDVVLSPECFGSDLDLLELRLQQIPRVPASESWFRRGLILVEPRTYVGYFNFHGPPGPEGWVEIGYSILPQYQREPATEVTGSPGNPVSLLSRRW